MTEKLYDISVSTRLPADLVAELDQWAERRWSDRSKTLAGLLTSILRQIREHGGFEQPFESVLGRLRFDPT
jgi:metal-responsive CopG/Arc/MetJ family transcriptional regulator